MHSSQRVLCVDGCGSFQRELRVALTACGVEVVEAANGIDAIMQFKGYRGDFVAIVIAHELWGTNGFAVGRQIRDFNYLGRILITGKSLGVAELWAYAEISVNGLFHKPVDAGLLATLLLHSDQG